MSKLRENEIIIEDYFDDNKKLLPNLISDIGEKNLKDLIKLLNEKVQEEFYDKIKRKPMKRKINEPLKRNQLRKFYDSFNRIYNLKIDEDQKKVQLLMLKSNAEYSANRLTIKRFGIFVDNRISIVLKKTGKEFEEYMNALKLHFEALVGYFPKN